MKRNRKGKPHHTYPQGGRPKRDAETETVSDGARNDRSWLPGRKGQGGEGSSKGYGGSEGEGTGKSGPEDK